MKNKKLFIICIILSLLNITCIIGFIFTEIEVNKTEYTKEVTVVLSHESLVGSYTDKDGIRRFADGRPIPYETYEQTSIAIRASIYRLRKVFLYTGFFLLILESLFVAIIMRSTFNAKELCAELSSASQRRKNNRLLKRQERLSKSLEKTENELNKVSDEGKPE